MIDYLKIGVSPLWKWHSWLNEFRTFLSAEDMQLKLKRLQVLLIWLVKHRKS